MKRFIALLISLSLLFGFSGVAQAATNINTIDVSTNLNSGGPTGTGCVADYPQHPNADVSTWRIAASVAGLGGTESSYVQPAGFPCFISPNAGPFTNGKHVWLNCYTFDSYYGGTGAMWLGVTEYKSGTSTGYATFWPAGLQDQTNIAAQGVPACPVRSGIVSASGR